MSQGIWQGQLSPRGEPGSQDKGFCSGFRAQDPEKQLLRRQMLCF